MTAIIKLGKAGRIVVPKAVRARLGLREGSQLTVKCDGGAFSCAPLGAEAIEKSPRPAARKGRAGGGAAKGRSESPKMKLAADGLPVIAGWKGFDAAKAVKAARKDAEDRLLKRLGR